MLAPLVEENTSLCPKCALCDTAFGNQFVGSPTHTVVVLAKESMFAHSTSLLGCLMKLHPAFAGDLDAMVKLLHRGNVRFDYRLLLLFSSITVGIAVLGPSFDHLIIVVSPRRLSLVLQ